jgi:hypothetical protein
MLSEIELFLSVISRCFIIRQITLQSGDNKYRVSTAEERAFQNLLNETGSQQAFVTKIRLWRKKGLANAPLEVALKSCT